MEAFRKGLLRIADDISLAFQSAGKTFGFLSDAQNLIEITGSDDAHAVRFPDHSDEGWPEVYVGLPENAEFQQASIGPLSRVALWKVARAE